ncbi:MAG: glycoside hydrolase family 57 protein [Mariprofundaceae bacterium]
MSKQLSIVFYWHMHQPFYREADTGHYHLPWVYLHAMKDYTDMAEILEQVPEARAVINYVPSLTAQMTDYAQQLNAFLENDQVELKDPLMALLAHKSDEYSKAQQTSILESCFRLNHERNLHRYPDYSRLWNLSEHAQAHDSVEYLGGYYFTDLVTWYHLGWLAETVREKNFVARRLIEKGKHFSIQDRQDLLTLIASLLNELPATHQRLLESGKIELTTTPYAHPIIPLMLDFNSARETVADALIPDEPYPHGQARAIEHIEMAKQSHEQYFGHQAQGCWPAEGAVCKDTLALLGEAGFNWCATGEAVLHHSLGYNLREQHPYQLYQPWLVGEGKQQISCFFRDDHLSDLIGFEYSKWKTEDAVANFMHELAGIKHRTQGMDNPIVPIIMDGENAWEHFHENGVPFLTSLYQNIADHPDYQLTTFSDYLSANPAEEKLKRMVPGSWVYGNLSTWIGDHAKTRAWNLLIEVTKVFDLRIEGLSDELAEAAKEQLRICEGSDWCWWFGDYNPSDAVKDFDDLYRQHLKKLYHLLGAEVPESLAVSISQGGGDAEGGGAMRRGGAGS